MLRKISVAVVALAATLALSACSLLEQVEKAPLTSRIVVQQVTMRVIEAGKTDEERKARATRVKEVAGKVQAVAAGSEAVTLEVLKAAANVELAKLNLGPADMALADNLVDLAVQELQKKVGDGAIPAIHLVTVSELLGWVADSAALYGV